MAVLGVTPTKAPPTKKRAAQRRCTPVQTTPGDLRQQPRPRSGFTAVSVPFVQQCTGVSPSCLRGT